MAEQPSVSRAVVASALPLPQATGTMLHWDDRRGVCVAVAPHPFAASVRPPSFRAKGPPVTAHCASPYWTTGQIGRVPALLPQAMAWEREAALLTFALPPVLLAAADATKAAAQQERDEFQHKNAQFDQQRAALLRQATDEANAERQRLLDEARQAADALSAKRQETLRNDAHTLNQAISRRTQQEVFAIARKALTDLAGTSLEERLGEVFTRRLRELDGQTKAGLDEALKTASEPALVRSAFDLPAQQRAAIQHAINDTFSAEIRLRFETAPDLISGIELSTNGQKVAWSIADYLASLAQGVDELLPEKDKPDAKAEPEPEEPQPDTRINAHGT